ncbi:MAG: Na+/H+ antiporter subunit A, partial [Acidimicrobiaceae bacterium]|nr:Na+/H+ antiporter subunit A [Acidimicrobiaceae bacterium]MYI34860.1 Na+/H+ antiporter subunit A [Acidimicrobiaceae bacterium]
MIDGSAPMIRLGIRAASPFAVIVGCYLLFAGHNNPGGGFAAGLVFGAVLALRTIAGFHQPTYGITLVAAGVFVVAGVALMPLLWGAPLFDQQVLSVEVLMLGKIKTGSALPFDIGVAA